MKTIRYSDILKRKSIIVKYNHSALLYLKSNLIVEESDFTECTKEAYKTYHYLYCIQFLLLVMAIPTIYNTIPLRNQVSCECSKLH